MPPKMVINNGYLKWLFIVTIRAMTEPSQELFQCAIAVAPVTSWRFYDSVYTERYMGTPKGILL